MPNSEVKRRSADGSVGSPHVRVGDVLTSLRHRAVSRSNNQDRAVHLRSTGAHVFNIVGVARAVFVCLVASRGVIINGRGVDGDTTSFFFRRVVDLVECASGTTVGFSQTELPNLGKEQIFVRLKPWCEARHFTCPSTSTIGRIIAGAHDKVRMIPVRLSARGKARLIKKRSVKPRRPKQYRPVKTGELIGMDALSAILGDAINLGLTKMAESSPGLTYAKLSWLQAWHIRDETYSAALAELVNHQYRHAFAAHWGDGTTSSSDGQRFRAGGRGESTGHSTLITLLSISIVMDVNLLLVSSFLKTLKLMSLNIWVVLKLKFSRNRDTVSGSFTEISNSLTRGSF